jgi:excisionase family DNA binding protein
MTGFAVALDAIAPGLPGNDPDRLLSPQEVAGILDCSPEYVRRLAREGAIPHVRLGHLIRFRRERILDWLGEREVGGA